ncbi:MAG TPA: SpoIVB peptidase, partial [Firmicutes bacterium]|nr:SpoIVB peptidase [Bacillota bacterium]
IPIKDVRVEQVEEAVLVPCGTPFGVKLFTDGVMVVAIDNIDTATGLVNPARDAGLRIGDIILSINGEKMRSNDTVAAAVRQGGPLKVAVKRGDEQLELTIHPAQSKIDGHHKIGVWVRDSSAGIGTMTFYDPQSHLYGGLGHPICDVDTKQILPVRSGEIVNVNINGVSKGISGTPGELRGSFIGGRSIGDVQLNAQTGIFGTLYSGLDSGHSPVPIALKQQIHTGPATIYTTIDGRQPKEYAVNIDKIDYSEDHLTQNMIISVTDEELLAATGGIVQGMSGSPILQDGKIVGAVTHVFVNEPEKGYGIFIENMYKFSKSLERE